MTDLFSNGTRIAIAITGVVSVVAALIGAAISFFVTNASLASQVAANSARIASIQAVLDTSVKTDSALTARVAALEGKVTNDETRSGLNSERIAALRTDVVRLVSDLREIETQFCASDQVRNLMHANDLRLFSLLWQRAYNHPYPTSNAYYPMICNRNNQSSLASEKQ